MDLQRSPAMGTTEWLLLIALTVLWSGVFLLAAIALVELPPLTLVLGRVGFAALALHLAVLLAGSRMPLDPGAWGAFLVMGTLNNLIPFSLIAWGQTHIASGLAAILNATTPLFAILVAHRLTRDEKMTANKLIGIGAGLAGVVVMVGPDALKGLSVGLLGQFACLAAALSYAFAGVYGRRFRAMGMPPLVTACGQVTATALLMAPIVAIHDRPWTLAMPHLATWAALLAAAFFCTALAYILYFRILAAAGATNLLLVTLLMPVGAILLGALVLDERLAARQLAGMAFIALGLAAIDGRPAAALRRRLRGGGRPRVAD